MGRETRVLGRSNEAGYRRLAALWIARMLVEGGGAKCFIGRRGFRDDDVAEILGLDHLDDANLSEKVLRQHLCRRRESLEAHPPRTPKYLRRNVAKLAQALELSPEEQSLVEFAVVGQLVPEIHDAIQLVLKSRRGGASHVISAALRVPQRVIDVALAAEGILVRSGLVRMDAKSWSRGFSFNVEVLAGLAPALISEAPDFHGLFQHYFHRTPRAQTTLKDFLHLQGDIDTLSALMTSARQAGVQGINVLLHGAPGVGKTELARCLAATCGYDLYEISSIDEDGDPRRGPDRFRIFQLCQHLLASRQDTFILFDEVEDVFRDGSSSIFGVHPAARTSKAWTNRLLEQNPVPSFWISNDVAEIDPAYLRRFDYVVEMKAPPKATRLRMLRRAVRGLGARKEWVNRMAEFESLTPAQMAQAARVARLVQQAKAADAGALEETMERLIRRQLALQGHPAPPQNPVGPTFRYGLDQVKADTDLGAVLHGLQRSRLGRLFLYGPPGTGKTAFAMHVARQLRVPLLKKTASDLLDKYVGNTEKLIARMFSEARERRAVLLLDEADTFLRGRAMAEHQWEISHVNELLVQMENFGGIFICATNFREITDEAALRRFDLKIAFQYLDAESALVLLRNAMKELGKNRWSQTEEAAARARLAGLGCLAPGDVAAVVRRCHVLGTKPSVSEFLDALDAECGFKADHRARPIGFLG